MTISTSISFQAVQAVVNLGVDFEEVKKRSISLSLKLESGENIETNDGRSLRGVEWSMTIYEGSDFNPNVTNEEAIGVLRHFAPSDSRYDDSQESCHISVGIEPASFANLWGLVASGRLPDWLLVAAKGLKYGNDPDGRDKIWDISQQKFAYITEVSFRFTVAALATQQVSQGGDFGMVASDANLALTAADFFAGINHLQKAGEHSQKRLTTQLGYVIGLLVALVLYLLLK